ncbi:hypothetical protein ScPMuIL_016484 [Solemya velum]
MHGESDDSQLKSINQEQASIKIEGPFNDSFLKDFINFIKMAFRYILHEHMQFVAGFGAASLYVVSLFPHVWGLPRYQRIVQLYKGGIPVPLDHDTKVMGDELLDKMNWDITSLSNIKFFMGCGQDIFHKGSTYTSRGAIIGVPVSFNYKTTSDVDRMHLKLNNEGIEWESDAGHKLLESVVLSENARKFALCRELHYSHSQHVHIKSGIVSLSALVAYFPGFLFNRMYKLRERTNLLFRLSMYSVCAGIGMLFCVSVIDRYNWHRDKRADRKAAETSKELCEGGAEFYSKLLQRNVAIRELMGSAGAKVYTPYGNEIHSIWRNPHVPLTTRKDYVQDILKTKYIVTNAQIPDQE